MFLPSLTKKNMAFNVQLIIGKPPSTKLTVTSLQYLSSQAAVSLPSSLLRYKLPNFSSHSRKQISTSICNPFFIQKTKIISSGDEFSSSS